MSQAPEPSTQPMETSQAAPALQEDVAGPSEPGADVAASLDLNGCMQTSFCADQHGVLCREILIAPL